MKYCLVHRLIYFTNGSNINNFHNLRGIRIKTRSLNSKANISPRRIWEGQKREEKTNLPESFSLESILAERRTHHQQGP